MTKNIAEMVDLDLIIPTYNEKPNLLILIPELSRIVASMQINCRIIIVDDASPDGTGASAKELRNTLNSSSFRIEVIERSGKLGLGTAYIEAYDLCLNSYPAKYIIGMDCDLSHDPKYLPEFLRQLQYNDMVIGSRYVSGGKIENWSWWRRTVSKIASLYAKSLLWWPIGDPTTAYVGFSSEALSKLDYKKIQTTNYGFLIELKYLAFLKKFRIHEFPIVFVDRVAGDSKISIKIILETVLNTLALRFRYMFRK